MHVLFSRLDTALNHSARQQRHEEAVNGLPFIAHPPDKLVLIIREERGLVAPWQARNPRLHLAQHPLAKHIKLCPLCRDVARLLPALFHFTDIGCLLVRSSLQLIHGVLVFRCRVGISVLLEVVAEGLNRRKGGASACLTLLRVIHLAPQALKFILVTLVSVNDRLDISPTLSAAFDDLFLYQRSSAQEKSKA